MLTRFFKLVPPFAGTWSCLVKRIVPTAGEESIPQWVAEPGSPWLSGGNQPMSIPLFRGRPRFAYSGGGFCESWLREVMPSLAKTLRKW